MVGEKRKINTGARGQIDYTSVSQSASEKVTNTVGTFLKKKRNSFQQMVSAIVRVKITEKHPEKVTHAVGTFLKKGRNGFQQMVSAIVRVRITKKYPEKVTNMVGTFYGSSIKKLI